MSAQQVDRWELGSTETTVVRIAPQVVEVQQLTVGGDATWVDGVTLTEDEWLRVGDAMGWIE